MLFFTSSPLPITPLHAARARAVGAETASSRGGKKRTGDPSSRFAERPARVQFICQREAGSCCCCSCRRAARVPLPNISPHPTVLPTRAHLCSGNRASKRVQSHSADHMSGCLAVPMAKAVLNSADTRALLPNDATRPVIVAPKAEQTVPPPRAPLLCLPRYQLLGTSIVGARGATPDPRHRGKRRGKQRCNAASLRCRPLAKRSPSMEPMTYDYNICYSRPATD